MKIAGQYLSPQGDFRLGTLTITQERIVQVKPGLRPDADLVVGEGWIVPGFIELQNNGSYGYDLTADPASVAPLAAALPQQGVTAFLPTIVTSDWESYPERLSIYRKALSDVAGDIVLGLHLEGPYLNPARPGAHPPQHLRIPEVEEVAAWATLAPTRLVTLAPEIPGAGPVITRLKQMGILVSAGHSAATHEEALAAFAAGVCYGTHLYNAMPPLAHRAPGLIGALLTTPHIHCGLIVDGVHSHPAMVNLAYRMKGAAGITLVTDAMAAAGMPPGRYPLGEQTVTVDETSARLESGSLAGSVLTMERAIHNMIKFSGCSLAEAVQMATLTPAKVLGMADRIGALAPGYLANVVVLNKALEVEWTLVKGKEAFRAGSPRALAL